MLNRRTKGLASLGEKKVFIFRINIYYMDYKIPDDIKKLCDQESLSDPIEQELVKKELVNFLKAYLKLGNENNKSIGNNSLANVTDITSEKGEFPIKGKNYPFERDVAGRMMRTRNYTMQEGFNRMNQSEVYVIAADRDWWDKYSGWVSIGLLIVGFILGIISDPVRDAIFHKAKNKSSSDTLSVKVLQLPQKAEPTSAQTPFQPIPDSVKKDSAKYKR